MWSKDKPFPLKNPRLISKNEQLLKELEINLSDEPLTKLINGQSDMEIDYFSMAYSGHQFGYFVDNLGDGRALNLGKIKNYNLQTKGSGFTHYSRMGDGKAVLRSSIREYLMSEAMDGLGIPTSRALALIGSDTTTYRDGNEECAVVLRASTSWVRFGTFEFAYLQEKPEIIKELADYVIDESYPHVKDMKNRYDEMFFAIVDNTIELMAKWQSVGFMHGVMNSDNMSIEGLTIDYGPYSFMERFEKDFICNKSDKEGRYSFSNQPFIARWNLFVLCEVLKPIINYELCEKYTSQFIGHYKQKYFSIMAAKLGLTYKEDDNKLLLSVFEMMEHCKIDYTVFFYYLSIDHINGIRVMSEDIERFNLWYDMYKKRVEKEDISKEERLFKMKKINPKYVLKNYMLQEAIDLADKKDYSLVNSLLKIAQDPYAEHKEFEKYAHPTPKDLGGFICSCSS